MAKPIYTVNLSYDELCAIEEALGIAGAVYERTSDDVKASYVEYLAMRLEEIWCDA